MATAINNIMPNGNKDNMSLGNGIGIGIGIDNTNSDSNNKRNNSGRSINSNFHNNFNNTTKATNGNSNERIDNVDGPVSFMPIGSMNNETENQNRIFESSKQHQLGELMSATSQGVRNFGYTPSNNNSTNGNGNGNGNSNVNVNFNLSYNQQIAASNALLNNHQQGTHTNMNNFPFPGMRNPMFVPDISFSTNNHNNGFYNNHHTDFSSSSAVQNPYAIMDGNNHHTSTQVIHGGGGGGHVNADRFDGEQSTLTPLLLGEGAYNHVNGGPNSNNNENHFKRKEDESRGQEDFISSSKRMRSVLDNNQHHATANLSSSGDIPGRAFLLYVEKDEGNLSHYQCLARKQMEVFEATSDDAGNNAQGRNRPILIGQIGIRCLHCAKLPPSERKTGSVYYPNRLEGIYQTAQKMTVGHLSKRCSMIPEEVRDRLLYLKDQKSSDGGGKRYWANSVRSLGVVETPRDGLTF